MSCIDLECEKRVFWSAYTMDKYLSAIFGRPCALRDEDSDQDFPLVVDDRDLTVECMKTAYQDHMNAMLGPINHHRLGRILEKALKRLYGVTSLSQNTQYQSIAELGRDVDSWRQNLPAYLDPRQVDSRLLKPLFQRQSNLLTLASGHLGLVIYRPCLLNDGDMEDGLALHGGETTAYINKCLEAAMSIVSVIDVMVESEQFYSVSWFAHYQAFCAVVVLYTYTIKSKLKPPSIWLKYYQAAERCQRLIAAVPKVDSLAQRLHLIMEEYRAEVVGQIQHESLHATISQLHPPLTPEAEAVSSWLGADDGQNGERLGFIDLPNWAQLDSLVRLKLFYLNDEVFSN
jgi:hypothetical protein